MADGIMGHTYPEVYGTQMPTHIMPAPMQGRREEEDMTIYDVFRHIISKTNWDGMDFNEENKRQAAAISLIDQLEELNLFGALVLNIKEKA